MTNILAFKPRRAPEKGAGAPHAGAAIVIFPGVRYERLDEGSGTAAKAPARSRPSNPKRRRQG